MMYSNHINYTIMKCPSPTFNHLPLPLQNGPLPNKIVHMHVNVMDNSLCDLWTTKNHYVVCTFDLFALRYKTSCNGDSGGPLICNGQFRPTNLLPIKFPIN